MANKELPDWDRIVRPKVTVEFEAVGIVSCELRFPTICRFAFTAAFAHSKKRVDWYTLEDLEAVIVACSNCHGLIEHLGKRKVFTMEEIVERVRALRPRPVASVFSEEARLLGVDFRNGEIPAFR